MPFVKQGEATEILKIESTESCVPSVSPEILENFQKFAANLKKIAPKAEDFLYFTAVMMHAAEAAALNDDGSIRKTAKGEDVNVSWDKSNNTWRWVSNDPSIKPYKNSNGDIFPEEELVRAHKKWVHKPLCIDHKSSSVDHVRGFIVDTYYDRNLKRVIALCALDKAGYPQLARNVSTGVSNCVSMGTAVGRAICTDCARVARTEQDFCSHMKNKTCYGEINIDLNPIELSIVMNGADQRATIKHVLAAANTLNTYVENKEKELARLADLKFNASINVSDPTGNEGPTSTSLSIEASDIEKFKTDLAGAIEKLQGIYSSVKNSGENTNSSAFNQSSGTIAMDESPDTDSGLALQTPQTVRFASADEAGISELREVTAAIEAKLNHMKQTLDKLAQTSTNTQEDTMTGSNDINKKGYYQGGGGVNEPTPGQAKYPKDPLNEELREKEDKQMVGEPPFPGVGPVDGMHPSPSSADPSDELQRKKMLARADLEERAMRRQALVNLAKEALQTRAYFQGGGGVNEPTPGKVKYPKDKLNEELRDYEDKQMVGQPPFPGVGPVDGLHPSPSSADPKDELKRKQMLARANALTARFVKAANEDGTLDQGRSAWEVFLGDKLLLTASVNDLSANRPELFFDQIATEPFGLQLIKKIRTKGAASVAGLIKKAQVPPPAGGGDPGAGAPPAGGDLGGGDPGAGAGGPPVEDTGKSGDPKQTALELAEKVRDLSSDLVEAVRALTGEQAEMGAGEEGSSAPPAGGPAGPGMADDKSSSKSASFSTATLNTLRKQLNGALTHAMKEAVAELNDHKKELDMIVGLYDKGLSDANRDTVSTLSEDAFNETKAAVADGFKLMQAFVKYARGTEAIIKRAEMESELQALAADEGEGDDMSDKHDSHSADAGDLMGLINDTNADLDAVKGLMGDDGLEAAAEDANDAVTVQTPEQAAQITKTNPDASVVVQASFDSRAGRAAMRAKLAADATGKEEDGEIQSAESIKFSDMLDQADGLADGQTQLDTKPSSNAGEAKFPLGLVETPEENMKAMLDVARMPPKVRKEAEAIQKLVAEGALDPADLDALVAEGLDKDAVAYWKKYFGQVDGGSEFATELVKEHVKAQLEEEFKTFRVKIARAYELAYDMAERGICNGDRGSISLQVEEIMKFDDPSFESLKRVVARHPVVGIQKQAGRLPLVGVRGNEELTSTAAAEDERSDYDKLSSLFGTKKGVF
jgi:hypothetical protein